MNKEFMKRIGKWFLVLYILQAVAGFGIGAFLALKYGFDAERVSEIVTACLGSLP